MGTGKHAVAVKAVIFTVEFFSMYQLRNCLHILPVTGVNAVIAGGARGEGVMPGSPVFTLGIHNNPLFFV